MIMDSEDMKWLSILTFYCFCLFDGKIIPPGHCQLEQKRCYCRDIRAEWKILKLEFAKVWGRFWTTSQHWFQNSFRNHDRTIRLVLNQTNVFYRNTQFYNGKMAKISPKINKIEIWPKSRPKVINSWNKSRRDHIWGMF